ncbi:pilus assembly protein [Massilia niastensis]|uniref:pilus assembly protein n=1 Tax=Massilia niastensis TaxID=544911 RepID=UPI000374AB9A|nr:PilC/PilY family type IV pilus protein [Massilia niastensis]
MNRILISFALALAALPAWADPTSISQLPLLNITGSGTVKPNLMLLFDNSGSMASAFTPDYVDDTGTCRSRATLEGGTRGCRPGDPPFNSGDFNRQYYNPKVRYSPPVRADGSSFPNLNRGATTNWTSVTTDGFGVNDSDLLGNDVKNTNLVTGFPDLRWCDGNGACGYNTTGYVYPTNERYSPQSFTANPYYYSINVAEYCTDASLRTCVSTAVNAPAPAGYPEPARVRWCDSRKLDNCQAKYVGDFKYPRYGDPNRVGEWYGTIVIGQSSTSNATTINSVKAVGTAGTFTITNGAVQAASGTNTATRQAALANALAASIIARTGLARPFTACVRTPTLSSVPACSSFGITLSATNVVAVVPISCEAPTSTKTNATCVPVKDGARAGDDLVVTSGSTTTALLTIEGSTNSSKTQELGGITLGTTQLFSSKLALARGVTASKVAIAIRDKIGTKETITAYLGGNAVSPICAAATSNDSERATVCLVNTNLDSEGQNIALGSLSNNGSKSTYLDFSVSVAVSDGVPTATTAMGASVFVRTDIVPARDSYPKDPSRSDCAGSTCTYDEEMTNFANWHGYYKTRNQMMKTAVGQAFQPITDNYNVGLVSLSTAAAEGTMNRPKPFSGTNRSDWYTSLYAMNGSQSTPIRQALHAIGKMYANLSPYNYAKGSEVVQYPCQQNFTFVTTDGYWNGNAAADVVNNDNRENAGRFCLRSTGCVDTSTQSANSLADVALYWYNGGASDKTTSLRPTLEDWTKPGVVPAASGENTRLHMKTYALGLGVDGVMNYEANYDTAPSQTGDFYKLVTGMTTGCPWNNGGAYVWPDPKTGDNSGSAAYQSRVDDLWHAAINGHGKYFSASDPRQVVDGLRSALSNIEVKVGAAAAAATSTPNISQQDNDIFSATFTTVKWYGELANRKIDTVTGEVSTTDTWNSSRKVGGKVAAGSDTRVIKMLDTATGGLKDFLYEDLSTAERAWFDNKCGALAQCSNLSAANQAIVNRGETIVNWLRGHQQYANDTVLRTYTRTDPEKSGPEGPLPIVLGDIASSKPAYLRDPRKSYHREGYNDYKVENEDRPGTVFAAANDGMLHAFDASTGEELWAYAPRITMKKLHKQAGTTYGTSHQFTTDGSPELADVQINGVWKTVLVAGLNGGGRGYYALDVTDPHDPKALWELCADPAVCSGANLEPQIGYSFGNPQFGIVKDGAGTERWVVFLTSGYNNIPGTDGVAGGDGRGYLFVVDVATGRVLDRNLAPVAAGSTPTLVTTGAGDTATPSGLARITAITVNPNTDPLVTYVYGGDNQGQMWRFDFTTKGKVEVLKMGDAGAGQPITTRPDVALCQVDTVVDGETEPSAQRVVVFGSGRLLDLPDVSATAMQSAYVLKDSGKTIGVADWRNASAMAKRQLAKLENNGRDEFTISGAAVDLSTQAGWFVDFDRNAGERINLDPKIVSGTLSMVTNLPSSSSACSVGGTSNVYQLDVCNGRAVLDNGLAGHTLSNNSAAVGFIIVRLPSGALKMITTTADGKTITSEVKPAKTQEARRAGWRRVRN